MPDTTTAIIGNLTDDPEVRYTQDGIARAVFRVAGSGRREQEASFFTVIVWRDQAEHAAQWLSRAAEWWSWVGSNSGAGPPRTAAPARSWRSWLRSWGRVCAGRRPRRPRSPRTVAPSDSWWALSHPLMAPTLAPPWTVDFR
jgi:Single-strand binding protein family